MSKISDLFSDEEKKQLSYLGSMLRTEPTEEEQEQQRILDAMDGPEWGTTNRVEGCRAAGAELKPKDAA
jgi:hypothetical protein